MNWPGGSPHHSRTSWPVRAAAACSSACSTTAPQRTTRTGRRCPLHPPHESTRACTMRRCSRRRSPRDPDHRRRATNVDFYTRVLGLRLVKKTVNQDDPTVYHPLLRTRRAAPAGHHFFEYPGATRGKAGAGMVHTIVWRVSWRRRSTSGSSGCKRGEGVARSGEASRSRIPKAFGTSFASSRLKTSRSSRSTRRSRRSTRAGLRRRSRLRGRSRAQQRPARGHARLRSPRRTTLGGAAAAGRLVRLRHTARGRHSRRRNRAPRRVGDEIDDHDDWQERSPRPGHGRRR